MFAWDYERVQIGDLYYNLDATNQTAEVTSQNGIYPYWSTTITTADIPASVTYNDAVYSVTSIGYNAFGGCSSLTSIDIPNSVTKIGKFAFSNCTSLSSLTIPASVTQIEGHFVSELNDSHYNIIMGSNNITHLSVEEGNPVYDSRNQCNAIIETATNTLIVGCQNTIIPNTITRIGYCAFYQLSTLTSINIPSSVTNIGAAAFNETGLTSVILPHNVTIECASPYAYYYFGAFGACRELTSVEFTDGEGGTVAIGNNTFSDCSKLRNITLPNNITSIGNYAFLRCRELTSVTLPSSLTSVGITAFAECSELTSITCEAIIPPLADQYVSSTSIPLYVPAESVNAYKAADVWKDFTNILPIPAASVAITANEDPQHAGTYYSTFYYSSGHYELPAAGVEAFVATVSGSDMNLTRIAGEAGVIPQGTAVILRSTIASYTLTLSDDAPVFDGSNALQGVDIATTTPANCYVLSAVDGVVGFYQYTGEHVGAHKAYLVYSGAGAPRRMRFVFDEENAATGVDVMEQPYMDVQKRIENGQLIIIRDGVRYNAQGQKVK